MSNYLRLKKMLYVVSLATISIVLGILQVSWGLVMPVYSFLQLDLSEIAILVAVLVLGTKEAIITSVIRSLARGFFIGMSLSGAGLYGMIVGEGLAVFASLAIILGFAVSKKMLKIEEKPLMYEVSVEKRKYTTKEMIIITSVITTFLTVILIVVNYFFATPFYFTLFTGDIKFSVFSFVRDTDFTYMSFLAFILVGYLPFNIVKGIVISIIFLVLKPRLQHIEF
jgi:riboflavin transporter FmnP